MRKSFVVLTVTLALLAGVNFTSGKQAQAQPRAVAASATACGPTIAGHTTMGGTTTCTDDGLPIWGAGDHTCQICMWDGANFVCPTCGERVVAGHTQVGDLAR